MGLHGLITGDWLCGRPFSCMEYNMYLVDPSSAQSLVHMFYPTGQGLHLTKRISPCPRWPAFPGGYPARQDS